MSTETSGTPPSPSTSSPTESGTSWSEKLILVAVAWFLFTGLVSLGHELPVVDPIHDAVVRPYEKVARVRQSWKMFGNPSLTMRWIEVRRVVNSKGPPYRLENWYPLNAHEPRTEIDLGYNRIDKLARSLKGGHAHPMRVPMLEEACRAPHDGKQPDVVGMVFMKWPLTPLGWIDEEAEPKEYKLETLACAEVTK